MEIASSVALSRLIAQQRALELSAANIANATTPGYRAQRLQFSDWLVRQPAQAGGGTVAYAQAPATWRDPRTGPVTHSGNPLDLAIGSNGFFTVQTPGGPRLTRAGHFEVSSTGNIVDPAGNALLNDTGQPLQLSTSDTSITVAGDGTIGSENGQIGKIGVVAPAREDSVLAEGDLLLNTGSPTQPVAAPKITQGAIEESDVQPVVEVTRMLDGEKTFQFLTQLLQAEGDRQQAAIDKIGTPRTNS
jgi:flagellar basal-body rod protein FlgF